MLKSRKGGPVVRRRLREDRRILIAACATVAFPLVLHHREDAFVVGGRSTRWSAAREWEEQPGQLAEPMPTEISMASHEDVGLRRTLCFGAFGTLCAVGARAQSAEAEEFVQGEKAPEGYNVDMWKKMNYGKAENCIGINECREVGENSDIEKVKKRRDFQVTKTRVRYKDYTEGDTTKGVAEPGKTIAVKFRILRQGKRSQNGLDGNAATIFSVGFGEDDGPKDALVTAPLGQGKWVKALEDAIPGMAVGGVRRVQVRADDNYAQGFGWMKAEGRCKQGSGQDLGVTGALGGGIVNREACLDDQLLPQPGDWAGKRRFARRFDETVIAEIELVSVA